MSERLLDIKQQALIAETISPLIASYGIVPETVLLEELLRPVGVMHDGLNKFRHILKQGTASERQHQYYFGWSPNYNDLGASLWVATDYSVPSELSLFPYASREDVAHLLRAHILCFLQNNPDSFLSAQEISQTLTPLNDYHPTESHVKTLLRFLVNRKLVETKSGRKGPSNNQIVIYTATQEKSGQTSSHNNHYQ